MFWLRLLLLLILWAEETRGHYNQWYKELESSGECASDMMGKKKGQDTGFSTIYEIDMQVLIDKKLPNTARKEIKSLIEFANTVTLRTVGFTVKVLQYDTINIPHCGTNTEMFNWIHAKRTDTTPLSLTHLFQRCSSLPGFALVDFLIQKTAYDAARNRCAGGYDYRMSLSHFDPQRMGATSFLHEVSHTLGGNHSSSEPTLGYMTAVASNTASGNPSDYTLDGPNVCVNRKTLRENRSCIWELGGKNGKTRIPHTPLPWPECAKDNSIMVCDRRSHKPGTKMWAGLPKFHVSLAECSEKCRRSEDCHVWTWNKGTTTNRLCVLCPKKNNYFFVPHEKFMSGSKHSCPPTTTTTTETTTTTTSKSTALTMATPSTKDYMRLPNNTNGCRKGFEIRTREECLRAAKILGLSREGGAIQIRKPRRRVSAKTPVGCSFRSTRRGNRLSWNSNSSGKARRNWAPLCRTEASAATSSTDRFMSKRRQERPDRNRTESKRRQERLDRNRTKTKRRSYAKRKYHQTKKTI